MKHTLFKLFLTVLLLTGYSISANADTFTMDGIKYETLSGSTAQVVSNSYSGSIVIPSSVYYNGTTYSVTSIGSSAFYNCSRLTSVTIPNSVTSIGNKTFSYCSGLTSITIPNSVTTIGYEAFYQCSGLTSVTIPNSVTSIGDEAFRYCEGLTSVTIPNSVTSIGNKTFSSCSGLTSITIPNSVTSIGYMTFSGCTGLTSVSIPNSVTIIGNSAFSGCSGLTSVTIPNSVTIISDQAFKDCTKLTSVTINSNAIMSKNYTEQSGFRLVFGTNVKEYVIGEGVTSIGDYAFYNSSSLTSVTIPNSVTSIGNYAFFWCRGLTSVTIPNSVTSIGDDAFGKCTSLVSVDIPNSVTIIGNSAFFGCSGLTSVTIPNSVTSIGNKTFSYCSGLTSITIPNSVTSIGNEAFYQCSGLTSVTIPNSVTLIDNYAFYNCSGLTSVEIPNSVTSIGNYAFDYCSGLVKVYITDLAAWCRINFSNGSANPLYKAHHLYLNDEEITNLSIPNSVTSIGSSAFYGCTGLTSVTIPNSVTSIGSIAFSGCSGLTSVTIPNSVTSIGVNAFNGCIGFTSLTIPSSVTSIGSRAFYNCSELTTVIIRVNDPTIITYGSDIFTSIYGKATLFVPSGSIDTYRNTGPWSNFGSIKEIIVNDGVLTPSTLAEMSRILANNPDITIVDLADATLDGVTASDIAGIQSGNVLIFVPATSEIMGNNVVNNGVCSNLMIADGQPFDSPSVFTAANATYSRTNLSNAWGTVCLPYEVRSDDNVTYYTAGTISGDVLTLTSAETLPAGTPAIYKSHSESEGKYSLNATSTSVSVVTAVQTESVTTDDITLVGSFERTVIDDVKTDAANEYYYINGGQFWHATKKLTINPFRAYFTVPKSVAPSNGFSIAVDEDDVTALSALTGEGDTTVVGIYSIDGKPQSDLQPGFNIVKLSNGKTTKILIK